MSRFLATMVWDARLQFRYGFYYAGAFVAVVWMALFSQVPGDLAVAMPVFLLGNMTLTTFYFIAGLVLLEKGQGTLAGLLLTPLRRGEYLLSKVATLALLAGLENVAIVLIGYGTNLNWLWLLLGLGLVAAIYVLLGFIAVSRFAAINEYLLPSGLITLVLSLPLIDYFGLWSSFIFYLLPTYPPLFLLKAAFRPVEPWQFIYGILGSILWIGIGFWWGKRVFERFIVN